MDKPEVLWGADDVRVCLIGERKVLFAKGDEDAEGENFIAWPVSMAFRTASKSCIKQVLNGEAPINLEYEMDGSGPLRQCGFDLEGEATVLEFKFGAFGAFESLAEGAGEYELYLAEWFGDDNRLSINNITRHQAEERLELL